MGYIKLLDIINSYAYKLGYEHDFFKADKLSKILSIKLANANVVQSNKTDKSSHQSHIAVTGGAISFFFDKEEFGNINEKEINLFTALISKRNIEDLKNKEIQLTEITKSFVKGDVSIGKRTQNQVQLSKSIASNCVEFNELRNSLFENDLIILIKMKETDDIYIWGIPKYFYLTICKDYDLEYNTSTFFDLAEEFADQISSGVDEEGMFLDVYTEKSTDGNGNCYLCGCSLAKYMRHIPVAPLSA